MRSNRFRPSISIKASDARSCASIAIRRTFDALAIGASHTSIVPRCKRGVRSWFGRMHSVSIFQMWRFAEACRHAIHRIGKCSNSISVHLPVCFASSFQMTARLLHYPNIGWSFEVYVGRAHKLVNLLTLVYATHEPASPQYMFTRIGSPNHVSRYGGNSPSHLITSISLPVSCYVLMVSISGAMLPGLRLLEIIESPL